jgi:predicted ArsR family transcriptional regulator
MSRLRPRANLQRGLEKQDEHRVHRALGDEHRARIVEELDRNPGGLDAHELARRLELHANTVRWHLGILADAGLVASRPGERTSPGRPRVVYALRSETDAARHENYRLLAEILAGTMAELDDGPARAAEAGRAWGRYLVRRLPPNVRTSDAAATREVVDLLAHEGFRPEAGGGEIRMHTCPFRELADSSAGIVCAVHRGLISGALEELRSSLEVERLDAFVEPELCVARLGRRA